MLRAHVSNGEKNMELRDYRSAQGILFWAPPERLNVDTEMSGEITV